MTGALERASKTVAEQVNRRRFFRVSADRMFGVTALLAAGKLASGAIPSFTSDCDNAGPGCPYGCGPSQCCNKSSRSSGCKCGTGTNCKSGGNCHGKDGDWSGTSCWTCTYVECLPSGNVQFTTTCCDCATSGCGDSSGRCISYSSTSKVIGPCGGAQPTVPVGTILASDTGDPRGSFGDISMFYKKNGRRTVLR